MDIAEAIHQRKSIRAFKPDIVPQHILKEIMELAFRAPSWENFQPWEFAIVGGQKLEKIRQEFIEKAEKHEQLDPEIAFPREFPEPYKERGRAASRKIFELKGISREDKEKRRLWRQQGLKLFGAPSAIYIYIDRSIYFQEDSLNVWPIFDCGLIAENIMLLAVKYGLGTIPEVQAVSYPDVLRKALEIPDSKLIVLGIAIGYPDWDDPINTLHTAREPLDMPTRWFGL